jgi:hypothetical protein
MDVRLPDGTLIRGVPEGTTKAELAGKLKANGMTVPDEWMTPQKPNLSIPAATREEADARTQATRAEYEAQAPKTSFTGAVKDLLFTPPEQIAGSPTGRVIGEKLGDFSRTELGDTLGKVFQGSLGLSGLGVAAEAGIGGAKQTAAGTLESASRGLRSGAERAMTSALKPTVEAHLSGKAKKAVGTMLDAPREGGMSGYNASEGSVLKMSERVKSLMQGVDSVIDEVVAKNPSAGLNREAIAKELGPVFEKYERQLKTSKDLQSIQEVYNELMNHPLIKGDNIPLKLAQQIKQGAYRSLGNSKYGQNKPSEAETDALKALASALRSRIEAAAPKVTPLNKEASELINALGVSERRALMEANKNILGLSVLASSPVRMAEFLVDRTALFKSLIARMLNTTSKSLESMASGVRRSMPADDASLKLAPLGANIPGLPTPPASATRPGFKSIPAPPNLGDLEGVGVSPGASVARSTAQRNPSPSIEVPPNWTIAEKDMPLKTRKSGEIDPRKTETEIPGKDLHPNPIVDNSGYVAWTEADQLALQNPSTTIARRKQLMDKLANAIVKAGK